MNTIFPNENITPEEVQNILGLEETISLEFKDARALDKADEKKLEVGKDVSAFANSGGGTIIYGITEKDHKAQNMSFINGNVFTKEWLETVIHTKVQRKIEGLKITPVRFENENIEKSVYVVQIPESQNAPHMAKDNRYYRRFNFMAVPMEEYEIRNLYSRLTKTQLVFDKILTTQKGHQRAGPGKYSFLLFNLNLQVKNVSQGIELHYKVEIYIPDAILASGLDQDSLVKYKVRFEDRLHVYSIPNTSPLFQNEVTTMPSISVKFTPAEFNEITARPIIAKLYFTNGVVEIEVNPSEVCFMDNKPITRDMLAF